MVRLGLPAFPSRRPDRRDEAEAGGPQRTILPIDRLREKLDAIGYGVFIPVFFVASGLRFDLDALTQSTSTLLRVPIFLGALLAAWIEHFERIGAPALLLLAALMVAGLIVDAVAAVIGARRVGASRSAVIASLVGGGARIATPGAVSRAHRCLLYTSPRPRDS